ncbi:unnamed protein product [Didymodactylos carnosus]|uniref:PRA1 family protein n=1 Tax=Didymodactylos carnosus TaxID=1234261 RepID=A0A813SZU3_9BILA|nr:unnamed protein product [Didymodactylos carnosus]CAF0838946.1 unnamed protein product [Didymodactylos carnosus]CAF3587373.1 unnamed protein product [Didymodactylos carnosus]CAF3623860.1 unnamed protein product [Didymodactylos carnosus]
MNPSAIRREFQDLAAQTGPQELRFSPFRNMNDFLIDNYWSMPNFSDINYPVDFLFGLVVVSAVLMAFVYVSPSTKLQSPTASIESFLQTLKRDRPIIILVALLGVSYLILSMLGKILVFIAGIVLPIQAILLHAAFRKRNIVNKIANKVELFGLKNTPIRNPTSQSIRLAPLRSMKEFVGGNNWTIPSDLQHLNVLQKQVLQNLVYYQTNYLAFLVSVFILVALYKPAAIVFGLFVTLVVLGAFVYLSKHGGALNAIKRNRPLVMLAGILVLSFFIIKFFGTIFAFLFGIVLPIAGIIAHAAMRGATFQNKIANKVESLGLQGTPVGWVLHCLGADESDIAH